MYIDKRKDRSGQIYYSFSYIDPKTKKRVRVKKAKAPICRTLEEAEKWAEQFSVRLKRKNQLEDLQLTYPDFFKLLDKYMAWYRTQAPNSHSAALGYMQHYVLGFFLSLKKESDINNWYLLHQEFIDHLTNKAKTRQGKRLANATINNVIKTYNTFIECMKRYNLIAPASMVKCPAVPKHKLNMRDLSDVISEAELTEVSQKLPAPISEFFQVLWHTGMRFNELFTLPIDTLYKGNLPSASLHDELTRLGLEYFGYIRLESQGSLPRGRRDENGAVPRKPLKGFKTISPKNARLIPIFDKSIWNVFARRYLTEMQKLNDGVYTRNKSDYLFFDDLEWNKANLGLAAAYEGLDYKPKSYHCCRHSFVTRFVGQTKSFFLTRAITGHRSSEAFERYLHIFEQLVLESQQNSQVIEEIT
ncbi:MAG: hypothetical protein ACOH5I_21805 [Oligoflexus sp.]